MRSFIYEVCFVVILFCIAVLFGQENTVSVLKEITIFYGTMAVVGVLILCFMGYALTKAMNPRIQDKKEEKEI